MTHLSALPDPTSVPQRLHNMPQASDVSDERPFSMSAQFLADLDASAVADLVSTASDIVLVLDAQGVIRDVACHGEALLGLGCADWIGKSWLQTVTTESRPKIEALLQSGGEPSRDGVRWRHVNADCVEPVLSGPSGAVALFWHGRIPMCLSVAPHWWRKK